jgi:hypothetical protein
MLRSFAFYVVALIAFAGPIAAQSSRNPFGVADVADPFSPRVQQLAKQVWLKGDASDQNAPQWAPHETQGEGRGLDGEWYGRWAVGTAGSARIKVVGDTLFALYTDHAGSMTGRTWLLEARLLDGGQLVGSWVQVGNPRDTGPFIGRIVDDERIDGVWSWNGRERWDFRRRLGARAIAVDDGPDRSR